jgi:hypothetical protein
MPKEKELEEAVHDLILELCEVLYRRGYRQVRIGPLMKLVGVSDENASHHEDEIFVLDKEFSDLLEQRSAQATSLEVPKNTILH